MDRMAVLLAVAGRWHASRPNWETGWSCYFAQQVIGAGYIKIGRSQNVGRRIAELERAQASPLRLVVNVPEWVLSEAEAHVLLAGHRIVREWFEASDVVMALAEYAESLHRRLVA